MSDVFSQLFSNGEDQVSLNGFPQGDHYSFAVYRNGLFEREIVPFIGKFITLKTPFTLPTGDVGSMTFTFGDDFKMIPIGILNATIDFYRKVMQSISSEVMTMVVFDTEINDYKIVVPKQTVAGASVRYDQVEFGPHEKYIISMHSHVNMGAFFSSVDDNDEKRAMFYGVIGKLSQSEPEMKFRAKKDKVGFALTPELLFDPLAKGDYTVSDTNILNISQASYAVTTWAENQRAPVGGTRVYDYRPGNSNQATTKPRHYDSSYVTRNGVDYWEDDLDAYYPGGAYYRNRNSKSELDFIDPKVSLALDEFSRVYSEYLEKNLATDLTQEELMEYYQSISNELGNLLESLDVEEDFFDLFYSDFFEPSYNAYAIGDDEEDDLRDTPSVFSNPITVKKN